VLKLHNVFTVVLSVCATVCMYATVTCNQRKVSNISIISIPRRSQLTAECVAARKVSTRCVCTAMCGSAFCFAASSFRSRLFFRRCLVWSTWWLPALRRSRSVPLSYNSLGDWNLPFNLPRHELRSSLLRNAFLFSFFYAETIVHVRVFDRRTWHSFLYKGKMGNSGRDSIAWEIIVMSSTWYTMILIYYVSNSI